MSEKMKSEASDQPPGDELPWVSITSIHVLSRIRDKFGLQLAAFGIHTDSLRTFTYPGGERILANYGNRALVLCERPPDQSMTLKDVMDYIREKLDSIVDEAKASPGHVHAMVRVAAYIGDEIGSEIPERAAKADAAFLRLTKQAAKGAFPHVKATNAMEALRFAGVFPGYLRGKLHIMPSFGKEAEAEAEEHARRVVREHGGDADSILHHHICTPADPAFERKNPRLHEYTNAGGLRQLVGRLAKQYELVLVSADPDTPMDLRLTGVILAGAGTANVDKSAVLQVSSLLGQEGVFPGTATITCDDDDLPSDTTVCWSGSITVSYDPKKGVRVSDESASAFAELAEVIHRFADDKLYVVLDTDDIDDTGELMIELRFAEEGHDDD